MRTAVYNNRLSYSCPVIDAVSEVWAESVINMPAEVWDIDVRADIWIDAVVINVLVGVMVSIGIGMLSDGDTNGLLATIIALEFAMPTSLADSKPFC